LAAAGSSLRQDDPQLLDETEAARLLGLSRRFFQLDRFRGGGHRIPYHRFGRMIRYERKDLLAYLEATRVPANCPSSDRRE